MTIARMKVMFMAKLASTPKNSEGVPICTELFGANLELGEGQSFPSRKNGHGCPFLRVYPGLVVLRQRQKDNHFVCFGVPSLFLSTFLAGGGGGGGKRDTPTFPIKGLHNYFQGFFFPENT